MEMSIDQPHFSITTLSRFARMVPCGDIQKKSGKEFIEATCCQ